MPTERRPFARLSAALLLIGTPAATMPAAQAQTTAERLAALPETMLGVGKSYRNGDTSVTLYWGEPMVDPMIGVWLTDWADSESWGSVRDGTRGMLDKARLTKVIREADFQSPRFPGLHGFYGEYETGMGSRIVWILIAKGVLMKVNASYFRPEDHDRIYREVEQKLFDRITLDDKPDTARLLSAGAN
jgi:hypothetical protein